MIREELIMQLERLVEEAEQHDDTQAAAAILAALLGAMLINAEAELMRLIVPFCAAKIRTIQSRWN